MIRLIKPTIKYKKKFIDLVREFRHAKELQRHGGREIRDVKELDKNFGEFLTIMRNHEQGKNLPKGYVPSAHYWLIDGSNLIGETSIRYKLTPKLRKLGGHIGYSIRPTKRKMGYGTKILALALKKTKKLGITKVLVTCDDHNIGSRKIIEANCGHLQDTIRYESKLKRRYWITVQ